MTAPFRQVHTVESAINTIESSIKNWEMKHLRTNAGLALFGIFKQANSVTPQKEEVLQSVSKLGKP